MCEHLKRDGDILKRGVTLTICCYQFVFLHNKCDSGVYQRMYLMALPAGRLRRISSSDHAC